MKVLGTILVGLLVLQALLGDGSDLKFGKILLLMAEQVVVTKVLMCNAAED